MHIFIRIPDSQRHNHDLKSKFRDLNVNDKVFVKNFVSKVPRYISGTIIDKHPPYSYTVNSNGKIKRVHIDHLIADESDNEADFNDNFRLREEEANTVNENSQNWYNVNREFVTKLNR